MTGDTGGMLRGPSGYGFAPLLVVRDVFADVKNLQVFYAVVCLVVIAMMYNLTPAEGTSEVLLHQVSVIGYFLSVRQSVDEITASPVEPRIHANGAAVTEVAAISNPERSAAFWTGHDGSFSNHYSVDLPSVTGRLRAT